MADDTNVKVCIVACPRSGTRYTSEVFRAAGIDVLHEKMGERGISDWTIIARRIDAGYKILHQVRHPLDCITSMRMIVRDFNYGRLLQSIAAPPNQKLSERRTECLARIWLYYNAQCEALASATYRVESDEEWNTACRQIGLPAIPRASISTSTNSRKTAYCERYDNPVTLEEIRREAGEPIRNAIIRMAERYGYRFD